ncbi:MAG: sortase B protein-sorting domain-containing protein [Candidatus Ventricola sp.]
MKRVWMILCLLCVMLGNAALAESFSIRDANGQKLTPEWDTVYVLDSGEYTVSGESNTAQIAIREQSNVRLILDSVKIDLSKTSDVWQSPITVFWDAELTLVLADHSSNTLKASNGPIMDWYQEQGSGYAAISNDGKALSIQCESASGKGHQCTEACGALLAVGGYSAAGIGGSSGQAGHDITINGGRITAKGCATPQRYGSVEFSGAGIGSGYGAQAYNIVINGGIVDAQAQMDGAGIGAAGEFSEYRIGAAEDIIINGGVVTARGGAFAAGIGGGGFHGPASRIAVNGGTVTAIGGEKAAGIGGAQDGTAKDIQISGGTVMAVSSYAGAGIGGGYNGTAQNIVISGGQVTAIGGIMEDISGDPGTDGEGIGRGGYLGHHAEYVKAPSGIFVAPENGKGTAVLVGSNEDNAAELQSSPFSGKTDITGLISDYRCVLVGPQMLLQEKGNVVLGEAELSQQKPVQVPTLILPEDASDMAAGVLTFTEVPADTANTMIFNVHWVDEEGNEIPLPAGSRLCFPYPDGLDQDSADNYQITIIHTLAKGRTETYLSQNGEIEFLKQGMCIEVTSFSPFEITWEEYPIVDLPKTGDHSQMRIWLALILISSAMLLRFRIVRKQRS